MTNPKQIALPEPRRLSCARCGTEFGCDLSGECWCAEETAKLPMPVKGEDCLCRDCLRKAAAEAVS
ncbi:cysteine-rich CWC family protein [Bradyrhizobium sp. 930_D9_N1_4]|uniref:cysteine-rich CWC family protein n=1 Tax=Bradyrhizobium sp. 930_D9_N1_4 TaxID=3240374 RepID=UPI003F8B113D